MLARTVLGLFAIYALFESSAFVFGSDRGQAGLIVAALVVSATVAVQWMLSGQTLLEAMRAVGLGRPRAPGVLVSAGVSALLLLVIPAYARATESALTIEAGSLSLLPGLFAQGGLAEE